MADADVDRWIIRDHHVEPMIYLIYRLEGDRGG
eukprot:COSAG06_NODE_64091_length_260_cov_0.962733_1_plen_32_part_01